MDSSSTLEQLLQNTISKLKNAKTTNDLSSLTLKSLKNQLKTTINSYKRIIDEPAYANNTIIDARFALVIIEILLIGCPTNEENDNTKKTFPQQTSSPSVVKSLFNGIDRYIVKDIGAVSLLLSPPEQNQPHSLSASHLWNLINNGTTQSLLHLPSSLRHCVTSTPPPSSTRGKRPRLSHPPSLDDDPYDQEKKYGPILSYVISYLLFTHIYRLSFDYDTWSSICITHRLYHPNELPFDSQSPKPLVLWKDVVTLTHRLCGEIYRMTLSQTYKCGLACFGLDLFVRGDLYLDGEGLSSNWVLETFRNVEMTRAIRFTHEYTLRHVFYIVICLLLAHHDAYTTLLPSPHATTMCQRALHACYTLVYSNLGTVIYEKTSLEQDTNVNFHQFLQLNLKWIKVLTLMENSMMLMRTLHILSTSAADRPRCLSNSAEKTASETAADEATYQAWRYVIFQYDKTDKLCKEFYPYMHEKQSQDALLDHLLCQYEDGARDRRWTIMMMLCFWAPRRGERYAVEFVEGHMGKEEGLTDPDVLGKFVYEEAKRKERMKKKLSMGVETSHKDDMAEPAVSPHEEEVEIPPSPPPSPRVESPGEVTLPMAQKMIEKYRQKKSQRVSEVEDDVEMMDVESGGEEEVVEEEEDDDEEDILDEEGDYLEEDEENADGEEEEMDDEEEEEGGAEIIDLEDSDDEVEGSPEDDVIVEETHDGTEEEEEDEDDFEDDDESRETYDEEEEGEFDDKFANDDEAENDDEAAAAAVSEESGSRSSSQNDDDDSGSQNSSMDGEAYDSQDDGDDDDDEVEIVEIDDEEKEDEDDYQADDNEEENDEDNVDDNEEANDKHAPDVASSPQSHHDSDTAPTRNDDYPKVTTTTAQQQQQQQEKAYEADVETQKTKFPTPSLQQQPPSRDSPPPPLPSSPKDEKAYEADVEMNQKRHPSSHHPPTVTFATKPPPNDDDDSSMRKAYDADVEGHNRHVPPPREDIHPHVEPSSSISSYKRDDDTSEGGSSSFLRRGRKNKENKIHLALLPDQLSGTPAPIESKDEDVVPAVPPPATTVMYEKEKAYEADSENDKKEVGVVKKLDGEDKKKMEVMISDGEMKDVGDKKEQLLEKVADAEMAEGGHDDITVVKITNEEHLEEQDQKVGIKNVTVEKNDDDANVPMAKEVQHEGDHQTKVSTADIDQDVVNEETKETEEERQPKALDDDSIIEPKEDETSPPPIDDNVVEEPTVENEGDDAKATVEEGGEMEKDEAVVVAKVTIEKMTDATNQERNDNKVTLEAGDEVKGNDESKEQYVVLPHAVEKTSEDGEATQRGIIPETIKEGGDMETTVERKEVIDVMPNVAKDDVVEEIKKGNIDMTDEANDVLEEVKDGGDGDGSSKDDVARNKTEDVEMAEIGTAGEVKDDDRIEAQNVVEEMEMDKSYADDALPEEAKDAVETVKDGEVASKDDVAQNNPTDAKEETAEAGKDDDVSDKAQDAVEEIKDDDDDDDSSKDSVAIKEEVKVVNVEEEIAMIEGRNDLILEVLNTEEKVEEEEDDDDSSWDGEIPKKVVGDEQETVEKDHEEGKENVLPDKGKDTVEIEDDDDSSRDVATLQKVKETEKETAESATKEDDALPDREKDTAEEMDDDSSKDVATKKKVEEEEKGITADKGTKDVVADAKVTKEEVKDDDDSSYDGIAAQIKDEEKDKNQPEDAKEAMDIVVDATTPGPRRSSARLRQKQTPAANTRSSTWHREDPVGLSPTRSLNKKKRKSTPTSSRSSLSPPRKSSPMKTRRRKKRSTTGSEASRSPASSQLSTPVSTAESNPDEKKKSARKLALDRGDDKEDAASAVLSDSQSPQSSQISTSPPRGRRRGRRSRSTAAVANTPVAPAALPTLKENVIVEAPVVATAVAAVASLPPLPPRSKKVVQSSPSVDESSVGRQTRVRRSSRRLKERGSPAVETVENTTSDAAPSTPLKEGSKGRGRRSVSTRQTPSSVSSVASRTRRSARKAKKEEDEEGGKSTKLQKQLFK